MNETTLLQLSNEGKIVPPPPANLNLYTGDDYSRVGCTLAILLTEHGWSLRVYAPGYAPVGDVGCIERYPARPHGSTGICIDAYLAGAMGPPSSSKTLDAWRLAMPKMKRAEDAYALSSGSIVTS
ncbi:hypothetical protein AAKU55_005288 [Oxalobacteraceae bacterium GrIS 1.11]